MWKWGLRIAIVLGLVGAAWLLRATVFADKPIHVQLQAAERGTVEQSLTNSRAGTVRARHRTELSPEVAAERSRFPIVRGDAVEAGDVLLRLDDRLQRAQVELAQRELDASAAERKRSCLAAEHARREFNRIDRLASDEIVSEDLLDLTRNKMQTTEARMLGRRRACRARFGCTPAGSGRAREDDPDRSLRRRGRPARDRGRRVDDAVTRGPADSARARPARPGLDLCQRTDGRGRRSSPVHGSRESASLSTPIAARASAVSWFASPTSSSTSKRRTGRSRSRWSSMTPSSPPPSSRHVGGTPRSSPASPPTTVRVPASGRLRRQQAPGRQGR